MIFRILFFLDQWINLIKKLLLRYVCCTEYRSGTENFLLQDLVMAARGKFKEKSWKRSNGDAATIDDITVIVIPILPYKQEVCNPPDNGHLTPDEEVELEIHYDEKKSGENPEFSDASLELESEEFSVNREDAQEVTE